MKSALFTFSVLILLTACNTYSQTENGDFLGDLNRPDTVKPVIVTSFISDAYPGIFESAFGSDTKVTAPDITYRFYKLDIGRLKVESGKLIASDPIVMQDALPFIQLFPIGEFPVSLAMATTQNDERVGFSRVVFSEQPIHKWEVALLNGQKPISLKDTSVYCYGVDGGTGLFIDSIANNAFNKKDHSAWEDVFFTKAERFGYKGYLHEFEGHNLATFSTGYGDGCYATYIGFDKDGKVAQLLTDFGLVEWWKLEEKE